MKSATAIYFCILSIFATLSTSLFAHVHIRSIPSNGESIDLTKSDDFVHFTAIASNIETSDAALNAAGIPTASTIGKGAKSQFSNFTNTFTEGTTGDGRISGQKTPKVVVASDGKHSNSRIWFSGWGKAEGIQFNYTIPSNSGVMRVYAGGFHPEMTGKATIQSSFVNGDSTSRSFTSNESQHWGAVFEITWAGKKPGDVLTTQFINAPVDDAGISGLIAVAVDPGTQTDHIKTDESFLAKAKQLSNLAQRRFVRMHRLVAPNAPSVPFVTRFIDNRIEVSSDDWIYSFSSSGRETFRVRSNTQFVIDTFDKPLGRSVSRWKSSRPDTSLMTGSKDLLSKALGASFSEKDKVSAKRELILAATTSKGNINHYQGRLLVRVEGKSCFVIYSPSGQPIRIESSFVTPQIERLKSLLQEGLAQNLIDQIKYEAPALDFRAFYAPTEHRFEIAALSYIGEDFLNLQDLKNPFPSDSFKLKYTDLVNTEDYRNSSDYKKWCYKWWDMYGRVNGVRGNWNQAAKSWDKHKVVGSHHSLADYALADGEPSETRLHEYTNGKKKDVPFKVGAKLEPRFYEDLEASNVSIIITHSGPINDVYQFQRSQDIWIILHEEDDPGLGHGNLRHLFLEGCSGINYLSDNDYHNLFSDWIAPHVAAGIRTISGYDAGAGLLDRNGWRFFGRYNKGDSIADSWLLSVTDECRDNNPATIAYGASKEAAFKTAMDGRFESESAVATWAVFSAWYDYRR